MDAIEKLGKELNSIPKERTRPYLIGISGGSGCGKSTLSKILYENLGPENCLMFAMDTYYKDLTPEQEKNLDQYNFDIPDALDLDLLSHHLSSLMNWESIDMPTYSFETNKRQKEVEHLKPNKFIIFEGILAFHDKRMRDLMDIKVFIEIDDDIRLMRRIYRDMIYRGRKMKTIIDRYYQFVKPAYETYIKPTRLFADIIIPRGSSNTIIIDLLNYHLKYMAKHLFPNGIKKYLKEKKLENIERSNNLDDEEDKDFVLGKDSCKSLFKIDTVESIKYDDVFQENITLVNDENEKKNYLTMLKNYLTGNKIHYFDLYTDLFIKKIYEYVKNNILVFKNFENEKINSEISNKKEKLQGKNGIFDVYFFVPILLEKNEKIGIILETLKNNKDVNLIHIVSVFLTKDLVDEYSIQGKVNLKSVYCFNVLNTKYKEFIERGGYFNKKELFTNVISFSDNNFERRLAEYIELNQ